MVLLIIIPFLNGYFIGNIPYFQTNSFDPSWWFNPLLNSSPPPLRWESTQAESCLQGLDQESVGSLEFYHRKWWNIWRFIHDFTIMSSNIWWIKNWFRYVPFTNQTGWIPSMSCLINIYIHPGLRPGWPFLEIPNPGDWPRGALMGKPCWRIWPISTNKYQYCLRCC